MFDGSLQIDLDLTRPKIDPEAILQFASAMDALFQAIGQVHLRVLFLLDDRKKPAEFYPDLVGNLQWLLCTRASQQYRPRLTMAFARLAVPTWLDDRSILL